MIETRKLGWGLAALVVAGNMIGSGVYLLPVSLAEFGSSSIIGWVVCGFGALTLALMFAGLGKFEPEADGLSDFAERGLGGFFGYQASLAYWAACVAGNVAVAVAGIGYLAFFVPVLREPGPALLANLGFIWLATLAYILGARWAARFGAMTLIIGLLPIVLAVIAAILAFSPEVFSASWNPTGEPLTAKVPESLAIIFWAFLGVESAAALSRLVKNPARDVGRASLAGVGLAFVVYVAACVAVFGVIPANELATSTSPYADLAARVFGGWVAGLVAVCAVLKVAGTITGWTMMGGETARRAAEKGYMPRWFGGDGTRPLANPILNGVVMSLLAVISMQPSLGDQFGLLAGATAVLTLCIYALCAIGLFRSSTGLGWKLLAGLSLLFAAFAVWQAGQDYAVPTGIFFAFVTLGWGVVWLKGRRWRHRPSNGAASQEASGRD